MNKTKIITILMLIVMLLNLMSTFCNVYAVSTTINPDDYKPRDLTTADYQKAIDKTKEITAVIRTVGIILTVVMTMVLGIRYMLGSLEQRAEYKKTMLPMVVGIILLFAITTIVTLFIDVMSDFNA